MARTVNYLASDYTLLTSSIRNALIADDCKRAVQGLVGLAAVRGQAEGHGATISAIDHDVFAKMKTQVFRRCVRGADGLHGAARRRRR